MDITQEQIEEVVRMVCETVLGWEIQPNPEVVVPSGNRGFRTGFIQIAGAWEGAIACVGSETLVHRAAAVMFGMTDGDLTVGLLHDALGELTNMIGGNLKALLPGPSFLCLPAVIEGSNYSVCVPATRPVASVAFLSEGQPLTVTLLAGRPGRQASALQELHAPAN